MTACPPVVHMDMLEGLTRSMVAYLGEVLEAVREEL
jgi:hypothetical protein